MVNTFLPYSDFKRCAKVLDYKRLGKQRVEAKQIIDILENYEALAKTLSIPYNDNITEYMKSIYNAYKSLNYLYIKNNDKVEKFNVDIQQPGKLIILKGFAFHPAVKMWFNHIDALKLYVNVMITEWIFRGYKNTMLIYTLPNNIIMPKWLGNKKFHHSHQKSLLVKAPEHYKSLFKYKKLPTNYEYIWPVK